MTRILSIPLLMMSVVLSLWSQTTRGVKPVEMKDERGERFRAYDNSYAFIVGINEYKDLKFPHLNYAVEDAKAIATLLESLEFPKENIIVLTNEQATLREIEDEFLALAKKTGKNDRLLVYWAGHGISETTPTNSEIGYLIPSDGDHSRKFSTCLSMDRVTQMAQWAAAKHILFLVDACYGGLTAIAPRSMPKETEAFLRKVTATDARQIITAGRRDEEVVESPSWKHSAFTKAILDGFNINTPLADRDDNGVVTADELYSYLQTKVLALSSSIRPPGHSPVFARLGGGEGQFSFVVAVQKHILSLIGLPPGNKFLLDGVVRSENSDSISIELRAEKHRVEVKAPGRETYDTTFTISTDLKLTPAMKLLVVSYSLETTPPGASIKIDGTDVGLSPIRRDVSIGQHQIEISKDGYNILRYIKNVDEQNHIDTPKLELTMFEVSVLSSPRGAQVFLNDLSQAPAANLTIPVKPGTTYKIDFQQSDKMLSTRFRADGSGTVFADFGTGKITVSGAVVVVSDKNEVASSPAYMDLSVQPREASVSIDGKGVTAGKIELQPGRKTIKVILDGYVTEEKTVDLLPGQTTEVPITLSKVSSGTSWLWYAAGAAVIVGGVAYAVFSKSGAAPSPVDKYGSPPGFPINP